MNKFFHHKMADLEDIDIYLYLNLKLDLLCSLQVEVHINNFLNRFYFEDNTECQLDMDSIYNLSKQGQFKGRLCIVLPSNCRQFT